jgi:hypothetical protein
LQSLYATKDHHIYCLLRNLMSEPPDSTEVTKSDLRTSKATLQEENDIEDIAAASSGKPEFSLRDPSIVASFTMTTSQRDTTPKNPIVIDTDALSGRAFARITCSAASPSTDGDTAIGVDGNGGRARS